VKHFSAIWKCQQEPEKVAFLSDPVRSAGEWVNSPCFDCKDPK